MEYIKAVAFIEPYDAADIITDSGADPGDLPQTEECETFANWDDMYCDGVTQHVVKNF